MTLAVVWRLIGWRGAFGIVALAFAVVALIQRDAARDRADDIQQAYFQQQAEYKAAQAEAARLAREAHEAAEQRYRDIQEESDERLAEAESEAQSRADDFIRRNRLLRDAQGRACQAPAAARDSGAQGDNRSYPDAELVAVPASDVTVCTALHTRLTEAQAWARAFLETN